MLKSTIYHADQSQQISGAQETALLNDGVITPVGENLGHLEYAICTGFTWADVDVVLARLVAVPNNTADYNLTREALETITDSEMAFGTTKLLPAFEQVPEEFKRGNAYTRLLDCMFAGVSLPDGKVEFRPGFNDPEAPKLLLRVIHAHLRSFEPKHEHKIAGLGYLISKSCEL